MRKLLILAMSSFFVAGCSGKTAGSGCEGNEDCNAGQVCVGNACVSLCSSDLHCAADEICVESSCRVGSRSGGPEITSVDGDGTPDTDSTHAAHHFGAALRVTGSNLLGASAELIGAQTHSLDVDPTSTDSLLIANLPASLTADTYSLRIVNQLGEDQTGVTILQGEQGPAGSDADLNATEILARLNDGTAAGTIDPGLLPPSLAANFMTTVKVVASGTSGGTRTVSLNGTGIALGAGDGVQLVVIDLSTHAVRTDTSVTGPPFLHNFTMTQALDGQNLASVIAELDESHVVILATRGDAFGQIEHWIAAAAGLGASLQLSTVQSSDGYVLIGRPGLGEGNGIDAVVNSADGEARAVTVLLDDDFLARRDARKRNAVYSRGIGSGGDLDCNAPAAGWRGYQSTEAVLPGRTLRTTGGAVHVRFNGWTHTWDSSQARFQIELTDGSNSYTSGQCARAYTNGNVHATSSCDVVLTNVPAGVYTVRVNYDCYDSGASTSPDARLYCASPDNCTFFAEEL